MSFFTSSHHELEVEAAERDARNIAARRERAEERRQRLLDPQLRTTGRDMAALERQMREAETKREHERLVQQAEEREAAAIREMARAIETRTAEEKAKAAGELLSTLTAQMSTAHLRTTADLEGKCRDDSDNAPYARDRSRFGVSSAQVFDGEDEFEPVRRTLQGAQRGVWAEHAEAERRAKKAVEEAEKRADFEYARKVMEAAEAIEAATREEKRRRGAETIAMNMQLAEEKAARDAELRETEKQEEEMTIKTFNAPGVGAGYHFLAGSLGDSVAAFSSSRYRVDHYRGAPPSALEATRAAQQQQIAEKDAMLQRQAEEAASQAEAARRYAATARALERRTREEKAARDKTVLDELQRQAAEAEARKRTEAEERRGVRVSDDFYKRFGSSDR